jgi:uncharacterized protein (TIGR02145 family)
MTKKLIFIIFSAVVVVVAAGILAWQFWSTIPSAQVWSCGDILYYQGKDYDTVQIGDQCWFAENLDYDDGCSRVTWVNFSDEGWCGHFNGTDQGEGLVYQWSAAMNRATTEGAQGLCPNGWHIPSDSEWTTLENNVCGDVGDEGSALAGYTDLWPSGLLISDDDFDCSGFNILPVPFKYTTGSGFGIYLWSSTEHYIDLRHSIQDDGFVWARSLDYDYTNISRHYYNKDDGKSVRCVRD